MRVLFKAIGVMAILGSAAPATATSISDPAGDFLGTYTGPQGADLDIVSASVGFDGANYLLATTENGTIGTTAGSLFVWGVNRGAGTARLALGSPSVGAGVLWDSVVVMFPDGTLRIVTFPAAGPPTITNILGGTTVAGNGLSAIVPLSLLPSTGFSAADYTFTLWSRDRVNPAVDGTNAEIADFAPDSGSMTPTAVPEPSSWLMLVAGFGIVGAAVRRRRPRQFEAARTVN
jgi:hypothetical protein